MLPATVSLTNTCLSIGLSASDRVWTELVDFLFRWRGNAGNHRVCFSVQILPMTNSSSTLSTWEDPRDSVSMQISFYLFDLQNPLEVSQGQKPILKQMGPYVYKWVSFFVWDFDALHSLFVAMLGLSWMFGPYNFLWYKIILWISLPSRVRN